MFKRILIASASAGNGHVSAAKALEQAVRNIAGASVEVLNIDVFDPAYSSPHVKPLYGEGYIKLVNQAPTALGIAYDQMDKPWADTGRKVGFEKLKRFLVQFQPDLVISTHFIPAEIVSHQLCRGRINCASTVIVTDFDAHGTWFCRHVDRYFVALDETRVYMGLNGIDPERIAVTGIPINPVFAQPKDKAAMRTQYGLAQDRPVVLLSAGGFGVGPMEKMLQSLTAIQNPIQVVALCGKNADLKTRIEAMASSAPANLALFPIGYTTKMDEYMSAADIVLGKPGGLTTSEAMAKGLAFVIINPIPGQEERNSDHLLEEGAAIRCNELETLPYKLDRLLSQPGMLQARQESARRLGHPNAAEDIVRQIFALRPRHVGVKCPKSRCKAPAA